MLYIIFRKNYIIPTFLKKMLPQCVNDVTVTGNYVTFHSYNEPTFI